MHSLLRDTKFCDVNVTVADVTFPAHAVVLAAASDFLRAALNNACPPPPASPSSRRKDAASASDPDKLKRLSITVDFDTGHKHTSPAGFAAILECLYSGKLVAQDDLIPSILHLSTKLQLPAIRSACVAHLVSRVSEATLGPMLALGEELGCAELVEAAKAATRKKGNRLSSDADGGGRASEEGKGGSYTKVPWSKEEDEQILELVTRFGVKSWKVLEVHIPGRTGVCVCVFVCVCVCVCLCVYAKPLEGKALITRPLNRC